MPTKTSPPRRSSSRGSARSPAAVRRPEAGTAPPARQPPKPARTPARQILSPHARDALGIGLVVVSPPGGPRVWFGAAGPVGQASRWFTRGLVRHRRVRVPACSASTGGSSCCATRRARTGSACSSGSASWWSGALGSFALRAGTRALAPRLRRARAAPAGLARRRGRAPARPGWSLPIGAAIVCLGSRRARPADLHRHARLSHRRGPDREFRDRPANASPADAPSADDGAGERRAVAKPRGAVDPGGARPRRPDDSWSCCPSSPDADRADAGAEEPRARHAPAREGRAPSPRPAALPAPAAGPAADGARPRPRTARDEQHTMEALERTLQHVRRRRPRRRPPTAAPPSRCTRSRWRRAPRSTRS